MNGPDKERFISNKLQKANTILSQLTTLLQLGYREMAVNRMYYACFYCAQALLAAMEVYPKSHKGVLTLFQQHYVKKEKFPVELAYFYQDVFQQRQLADYSDEFLLDDEAIEHFRNNTNSFVIQTQLLLSSHQ